MTEEKQSQQYLQGLPKGEVEEMNKRRRLGTPPMHQLQEDRGEEVVEVHQETLDILEDYKSRRNPLTPEEVQEGLDKWILSRQPDLRRREAASEKRKAKVKKFSEVEKENAN